ncbi:MAG: hypothetical protein RL385_505 [Pseudomonadota bacterium]
MVQRFPLAVSIPAPLFRVWRAEGTRALATLEAHLRERAFMVDERFTLADIGLYVCVHVAHEARFDLASYAAFLAWLERVKNVPGVLAIDSNP